MSYEPVVTYRGFLDMQVCVPAEFTNEQAIRFAQKEYPCGTEYGWAVRKKDRRGNPYQERVPCDKREGCVHIMLDA